MKNFSKFCVGGAGSGVGKTTVTLGLLTALKKRGLNVAPFKCGPDYIDPEFHKAACGNISRNLDLWMMGEENVLGTFLQHSRGADVAVVEGVMGLFDGVGAGNEGSTAKIAKCAKLPVLLVINARGIAGTIAPLVKGFVDFEDGVEIAGVIANKVGSERHAEMLSDALDNAGLPPLLGYLPRNVEFEIPERHLGLISATESSIGTGNNPLYDKLAETVEKCFKIDEILEITKQVSETGGSCLSGPKKRTWQARPSNYKHRIGLALDDAFHFYYEDNLDILREKGFEIVPFSPLKDEKIPEDIDGIYIGGGFPESFANELSANESMKSSLAEFADSNGFIYAECGGLMYLSEGITDHNGNKYEMCGTIPVWTAMDKKMRSLGYREVRTISDSPLAPAGTIYRGHEFHWSSIEESGISQEDCSNNLKNRYGRAIETRNARGGDWKPAGFRYKNVLASYIHAHFASNPEELFNRESNESN